MCPVHVKLELRRETIRARAELEWRLTWNIPLQLSGTSMHADWYTLSTLSVPLPFHVYAVLRVDYHRLR